MKPHIHAALIKAWADGAQIQEYIPPTSSNCEFGWTDNPNPTWHEHTDYRIKHREFEDGAWYPTVDKLGTREVRVYNYGQFGLSLHSGTHELGMFDWIGEKLEIDWPEAE